MDQEKIESGKINKIFTERNYGFITQNDGAEVFFHKGDLAEGDLNSLEVGQSVEYVLVSRPKGFTAKKLRPIKDNGNHEKLINIERW